ncbi:MAG TPA: hypothetical protein VLW45_09260, partial [Pelomicrobium sp.]|nr:hypothetical protein [Pelomicrobium sp.]
MPTNSLHPRELGARLETRARAFAAALPPETRIASVTVAAPAFAADLLPPDGADAAYWAQPQRDVLLLGLGRAWSWSTGGAHRFAELGGQMRSLRAAWAHRDADATGERPRAFAGFAYDPDDAADAPPNLELRVPELLLARAASGVHATLSWQPDGTGAALARALERASAWLDALPDGTGGDPASLARIAAM